MAEWGILRIGKTYHGGGFFNETNQTPRLPRPEDLREATVVLHCLGSKTSDTIQAKVRYRNAEGGGPWINLSHKARVFGGRRLAKWFEDNIAVEEVRIEAIEPLIRYRITDLKVGVDDPTLSRVPASTSGDERHEEHVVWDRVSRGFSAHEFEELARAVMTENWAIPLKKGSLPGVPKVFDMVSPDGSIVGDAKFFTMVRGQALPPAKFSVIAEHVWLLEKTMAARKFLVFGNDRRVPEEWLRRYGHLVGKVEFYFLEGEGRRLSRLEAKAENYSNT